MKSSTITRFLIYTFLLSITIANAQIVEFEEVLPTYSMPEIVEYFEGSTNGSIAFADVDGDNDQDVVIAGFTTYKSRETQLYLNDGFGGFTKKNYIYFEGITDGEIAFADVDNDNDQDLLITGYDGTTSVTELWINNGSGVFIRNNDTIFPGVYLSAISFGDYDNDNDQDVIITGYDAAAAARVANLYENDGTGVFSLVAATPFEGVSSGSVNLVDIDGDNDLDVFITGSNGTVVTRNLYKNDGSNSFTAMSGLPFEYVYRSTSTFSDIDGDNDLDLLITGNSVNDLISELYENDGSGNFTLVSETPFEGVERGAVSFSDIDGDNDEDLLLTGFNGSDPISKLYENNGSGVFSEALGATIEGVYYSSVAFEDVDNDNDPDLLINGFNIDTDREISKLYSNDGLGNFHLVTASPPFDGTGGNLAVLDIDGDNDDDIILNGENSASQGTVQVYLNNGSGEFKMDLDRRFPGLNGSGAMILGDIDNDNDMDVFMAGFARVSGSTSTYAFLYRNDGNGFFSLIPNTPFVPINGSAAFSDFDRDNDLDLFLCGYSGSYVLGFYVYENDGSGNFSLIDSYPEAGIYRGAKLLFGDINGDNYEDFIVTGNDGYDDITKVFINTVNSGSSNFTEIANPFNQKLGSSLMFEDIDNDNDLDLIAGLTVTNVSSTKLFINDGYGNFIEGDNTPFVGMGWPLSCIDLDNDNDKDLFVGGTNIFTNDGNGVFSLHPNKIPDNFDGIASSAFFDFDGDNDKDLVISGRNASSQKIVKLYKNSFYTLSVENNDDLVDNKMILYPNPTKDKLTIQLAGDPEFQTIRLYNSLGQFIKSFKNTNKLDLSNLERGLYFLEIETNQGKTTKKIIKD
ncbi:T9SS type A sorting domain-containing protein [Flavobacteriaceae bacterium SZ-1-7]|uniref:T9SS type A sorting domain-containing protein n=1 Tax=Tamlana sedimenti TaxID=3134126 RepID=UPI003127F5BA